MKKTPVLRFARGRDRTNKKKSSEKEFDRPQLHRILSKPCLYWESEGVYSNCINTVMGHHRDKDTKNMRAVWVLFKLRQDVSIYYSRL